MTSKISFHLDKDEFKQVLKAALREVAEELPRIPQPESEDFSEVMDVREAAGFLHKKVPTIYGMTSRREIPHYKKGKKLYFLRSELNEWITRGQCQTKAEIKAAGMNTIIENKRK